MEHCGQAWHAIPTKTVAVCLSAKLFVTVRRNEWSASRNVNLRSALEGICSGGVAVERLSCVAGNRKLHR